MLINAVGFQPEYPLSHVLNLLTSHERFLSEDIQPLLDSYGFTDVDAVVSTVRHCCEVTQGAG